MRDIFEERKLKNEIKKDHHISVFLIEENRRCFFQARNGVGFFINQCENIDFGRKYTVTGDLSHTSANGLLPRKTLTVSNIYDISNLEHSLFDRLGIFFGLIVSNLANFRQRLAQYALRYLNGNDGALAVSLTLGGRAVRLDDEYRADIRYLGVSYLLAVSGFHLSIVVNMLIILSGGLSRRKKGLIFVIVLAIYCIFVGSAPSILRATLMSVIALINRNFLYKQYSNVFGLLLSMLIMLTYDIYYINDVGFLLSCSATFGILLLTARARSNAFNKNFKNLSLKSTKTRQRPHFNGFSLFIRSCQRISEIVKAPILTSLIATLFALPISLAFFGSISTIGIVVSLFLTPLLAPIMVMTFIFYPILLLNSLFSFQVEWLVLLMAQLINYLTGIFNQIILWFLVLPNFEITNDQQFSTQIWVLYGISLVVMLWILPREKQRIINYV
ncbi:MAG: ComEC/Rec2 family competence protein [Pseudomonadales bacterium]|nr:ComEC/Rec2 family competence protein [Pseudomonadales bacterium]